MNINRTVWVEPQEARIRFLSLTEITFYNISRKLVYVSIELRWCSMNQLWFQDVGFWGRGDFFTAKVDDPLPHLRDPPCSCFSGAEPLRRRSGVQPELRVCCHNKPVTHPTATCLNPVLGVTRAESGWEHPSHSDDGVGDTPSHPRPDPAQPGGSAGAALPVLTS